MPTNNNDPKPFPKRGARGNGKVPSGAQLQGADAKIQGQLILAQRVMGKTREELQRVFNVSRGTMQKRLADARAGELGELARELIAERLLVPALAVLENELHNGNLDAARDVLYGMSVLQKNGKSTIEHVTSNSPTLDAIRKERQKAIEGEVLPSAPGAPSDPPTG